MLNILRQGFYYLEDCEGFHKVAPLLEELINRKTTIVITNPQTEVEVKGKNLLVNGEKLPVKSTTGVVFILPESGDNSESFLLKGVPTVVFTKGGFATNLKTKRVAKGKLLEAYRRICTFIGWELQTFFRKYLVRKGSGITLRYRGKYGQYYSRENRYFIPFYFFSP